MTPTTDQTTLGTCDRTGAQPHVNCGSPAWRPLAPAPAPEETARALDALEKLTRGATQGEWRWSPEAYAIVVANSDGETLIGTPQCAEDIDYIVEVQPSTVLRLVTEVKRLRAQASKVRWLAEEWKREARQWLGLAREAITETDAAGRTARAAAFDDCADTLRALSDEGAAPDDGTCPHGIPLNFMCSRCPPTAPPSGAPTTKGNER